MAPEVSGYTIKHKIADGGMASVYLAVQDSLQRDVALKILSAQTDENFRLRFLNEGRLLASLSHPSVITIYDIGILPDGHGYIAMEYLPGGDLAARLLQPMPLSTALSLLRQLASAMAVVHAAGIVHRDIKPANILFRGDGTPVISDFGVARRDRQDTRLTMDGYTVGSPAYSSPEQLQGRDVDARADLYSLGVTFYQMLTANNPFFADSYADTIVNHLQMPVPELPAAFAVVQPLLHRLLAKQPHERFAGCDELIDAIDSLRIENADAVIEGVEAFSSGVGAADATSVAPVHAAATPISASVRAPLKRILQQRVLYAVLFAAVLAAIGFGSAAVVKMLERHQKIQALISAADERVQQEKYVAPEADSAVFYYRKVLQVDRDNKQAIAGLQNVAAHYEVLARKAFAAGKYERGMWLIRDGLVAVPDHAALLQLKKEQEALGHPTTRFFRRLFN